MARRGIDKALATVKRVHFVRPEERKDAELDIPLPIGYGQTISQPLTVKRMLEWLDVQPGQSVLDVGSGSGWTSALLATLVGKTGKVTAVELVPELVKFGRRNCRQFSTITFYQAGEIYGWPTDAPYDRILVSASAYTLPDDLLWQLRTPGKLVIPIQHTIYEFIKKPGKKTMVHEHPGYIFVPLLPGRSVV